MDRRKRIETDLAPASAGYRSNAMTAAGFVFTSGHIGAPISKPEHRAVPAATLETQVDLVLNHMRALVLAGGGKMDRVVEVSSFIVPFERHEIVSERTRAFLGYAPPLYHAEPVADVALHGMLEIDGIALVDSGITMEQAAETLRPFGQGEGLVRSGPFVMLNGMTAPGANLGDQTRNLLREADNQLRAAGASLANVVKLTVYISDFETYPQFNDATKELFANFEPPTRSVLVAPGVTGDSLLRIHLLALG